MRVLHVPTVDWQPTEGIARSCRELASELTDVESILVVDRDPGDTAATFAARHIIRGWTPALPWRPSFARLVRELRPDVVHLHGGELVPALAWSPALKHVPVVATCYAATDAPREFMFDRTAAKEHRANASYLRTTVARGGMRTAARLALARGRVRVLCTPNRRVEATFAGAGPVLRVTGGARVSALQAAWSDEPVVVFAGRAQSGRGVDDVIAAFATLHEHVPAARLRLFLLPGDAAARWETALASAPWADVRIGAVADLQREFAACHVGAFPFRFSATMTPALAAAEAMAVGLPIVATPVECLAPLVEHGDNGYLVPSQNPVALGDALARVLAGPAEWQPLSEGARKTIDERWSWRGAAATTRDAYALARSRA